MKYRWLIVLGIMSLAVQAAAADLSVSASGLNWAGISGTNVEFRVRPGKRIVWGIAVDQMNIPVRLKEESFEMKTTDASLLMGWWFNQQSTKNFGGHVFFGGGATFAEANPVKYRLVSKTSAHFKFGFGFDWYLWRSDSKSLALTLGVIGVGSGPRVVLLNDPDAKEQKAYNAVSTLQFGVSYWF